MLEQLGVAILGGIVGSSITIVGRFEIEKVRHRNEIRKLNFNNVCVAIDQLSDFGFRYWSTDWLTKQGIEISAETKENLEKSILFREIDLRDYCSRIGSKLAKTAILEKARELSVCLTGGSFQTTSTVVDVQRANRVIVLCRDLKVQITNTELQT